MQISFHKYIKGHTFGIVFEDVKVKIVDSFEDIRIKIVDSFEGVKR